MFNKQVLDNKKIAVLGDGVTATSVRQKLSDWNIPESSISDADWIVTSPGIPPIQYPECRGEFLSEIEFAFRLKSPESTWIGITGTNGKSTVTALISHLLDCPAVGNIGTTLISRIDKNDPVLAIELSSYQLEGCSTFYPDIAIILNITPDHLDRHKTMQNYAEAKANIAKQQKPHHTLILGKDPLIQSTTSTAKAHKIHLDESSPLWPIAKTIPLPGHHNAENALAALLACTTLYPNKLPEFKEKLLTFKGLEHRIEFVCDWQQRKFYNDSKGTNPESTEIAIKAFDAPIHLILGGKDKGLDLDSFITFIASHNIKTVQVFGEIKDRFYEEASKKTVTFPLKTFSTFDEATKYAVSQSSPGDIILFSPACSSFDQFKNFEERGKLFKKWVMETYGKN